jgi:hypothetical protein
MSVSFVTLTGPLLHNRPVIFRVCMLCFGFCLFYSCNNSDKREGVFVRSDFPESIFVKADTLDFDGPLNPSSFHVFRDSLVLSIDKRSSEGHFIYFHSLISNKEVAKAGVKGVGPGELLSCRIQLSTDQSKLFIFDYLAHKYAIWDIDKALEQGVKYAPEVKKLHPDIDEVLFLDDTSIVTFNSMYIESEKFSNGVKGVGKYSLPLDSTDIIVTGDEKFFPPNVNGAYLFASKEKDRVITADFYKDEVKVYDLSLNALDVKNGPDLIHPKYFSPDGRQVSFENGLYYRSYYPSASNSEHIYLLYVGADGINISSVPLDKRPTEIFKIDWDGRLLKRFQTDVFLTNISIDSSENFLYGTTWSSDGFPARLIRLALK